MKIHLIKSATWDGPKPAWFKGVRYNVRLPSEVRAFEVHQTAVAGGYGVSEQALARHGGDRWAALMERWDGSGHYLDKDGRAGLPYHYLYRPQERTLVALHHPRWRTWHGNGGNAYSIGFAIDGKWDSKTSDPADGLAEAFELAIEHASEEDYIPTQLEAHRQHSAKRGGDPGQALWPIFELTGEPWGIYPTLTHTTGSGRPIPNSWRPHGRTPELPTSETAIVHMPVFTPRAGRRSEALELVQRRLMAIGHDPGEPDGLWGRNTDRALSGFKAIEGLPDTDRIDGLTWTALLSVEE